LSIDSEEGKRKMAERTSRRKMRVGKVVSDKMDKTIVVNVETRMPHPLYGKIVRRSKRYTAHDEDNQCRVGDLVRIMETRPLSRTKRWRLVDIVEKAE
jgi:small subunit ribosomal protein S17